LEDNLIFIDFYLLNIKKNELSFGSYCFYHLSKAATSFLPLNVSPLVVDSSPLVIDFSPQVVDSSPLVIDSSPLPVIKSSPPPVVD